MIHRLLLSTAMIFAAGISHAQETPSDEEIAARIAELIEMADPRGDEARKSDVPYRERYEDAFMIDALAVGAPGFEAINFSAEDWESLSTHYSEYGFSAFSTTVSNGSEDGFAVFTRLGVTQDWIDENSDRFVLALSVEDLVAAKADAKVAIMLNSQSMDMLDQNVSNVQKFWDAGIRQMNFTYNQDSPYSAGMASSGLDTPDSGITELGLEVLKAMNDVGMIVDCSHSSDQTCIDAAVVTSKPMMLSHSNAQGLWDNLRNSSDASMRAVASTGGVICINFLGGFLNSYGDATPESIAKHIEYVRQLVGAQATCYGVDYVENYGKAQDVIIRNPVKYPPAQGYGLPTHMAPPADVWAVAQVLEAQHGWSEAEIRGLMGENLMRVYKANWGE